jgi:hypothetical protein
VADVHDVDRQITDLAARVDPIAFDHRQDPAFEDRRRAASKTAGIRLHRTQTYLCSGAFAALILLFSGWLFAGV